MSFFIFVKEKGVFIKGCPNATLLDISINRSCNKRRNKYMKDIVLNETKKGLNKKQQEIFESICNYFHKDKLLIKKFKQLKKIDF